MLSVDNENAIDSHERSLSDINSVLEFAKLEQSDLRPCVQCLSFSEHLENDAVKLLELEPPVLDALVEGTRVEIRGDSSDSAVLVTDKQTFDLREAETSNSMLLLPQLSFGPDLPSEGSQHLKKQQVLSIVRNYYELRPIKPRLKKLRTLLKENVYRGHECENDEEDIGKKYTTQELENSVQASDAEIQDGLKKLSACFINGAWRLLDFEYLTTVLHHVLQLCDERDWLKSGLEVNECCQVLADLFPVEVIQHVIRSFSRDTEDIMETDNQNVIFLSEEKVCKHFAELCLRNSGKFNLNDFLKTWQESVPEGMSTSLSQIKGMALIDRESRPGVVWYYCVDDLPENVAERFEALFDARKKWTLDDITPYVNDLTDDKLDVGALLTRYARASLENGVKMFSSRKTL